MVSYVSEVKALFVSHMSVVSLWFCYWIMHVCVSSCSSRLHPQKNQRIIAHHCLCAESLSVQGSLLWHKCSRSSEKYNNCVQNVSTAALSCGQGWKKYPALLLIYLSHFLMFWLSSAVQHSQAQHLSHTWKGSFARLFIILICYLLYAEHLCSCSPNQGWKHRERKQRVREGRCME